MSSVRLSLPRRALVLVVGVTTAFASLLLVSFAGVQSASAAATAPAVNQCNPPAFPTGAGFEVSCTVTITNMVTAAHVSSSTVTATACLAAAGVLPPQGCTTTVLTSNQLVTSVNQCNGVAVGGGSNVTCSVAVINDVVAGTAMPGVTVNQCVGSGTGGGTQPTLLCAPVASTTGATVTQCNGSATGGGASTRVKCNVTGGATALPVTINQCNGSANGGGSTVTCTTSFTNAILPAVPTPTTPTTPVTPTTPGSPVVPTTPAVGTVPPGVVAPVAGSTGIVAPVAGSTGTVIPVVGTTSPAGGQALGTAATAAPAGSLAFTGSDITTLVEMALLLLTLGGLFFLLSGRSARRARRTSEV
jgi:hypothetical protein